MGSYTGNGAVSTSNPLQTTGFQPDFVMIKRTDSTGAWFIFDSNRNPSNPRNKFLQANLSSAEGVGGAATDYVYFESTGFRVTADPPSLNASGGSYIYLAIKEN